MSESSDTAPDSPLARWDRPAALVLLGLPVLVVLAATFVSNGATRIYSWPWAFYLQASLLAPWFWTAWSMARGRIGLRSGWWISLPLLGALALSVLTSAHWHDALEASLVLATPLILLPFVAEGWMQASPTRRLLLMRCAGAVLSVLALTSLVTWFARAPDSGVVRWFLASRNPYPLGHWNYTGGLALLALPLTILLACRERGFARVAWIAATGVGILQFLSAGSRGAVLGLLAGFAMTVGALATHRRWSWRAIGLAAAALVVVVAGTVATNPRFRRIVSDPASVFAVGESEQQRLGFILTGLRIGAAHPWTGIGPGTTPYHYPEHRVDLPGSLENSYQLHCGPLQWWVDTGSLGLVALAISAGFLKLRAWRARRAFSHEAIAALAILTGYGVMWLTDYQLDAPVFPILLAFATAVLLAEPEPKDAPVAAKKRLPGPLLAVAPAVCALLLIGSWQARAVFAAAWSAKDAGDANGFIQGLRSAADSAPWHPYYQNHLARALAGIAAHLPPESAAAMRTEARNRWRRSIAISTAQDHPWLNQGWLALTEGHPPEAKEHFARAAAIQPRRTGLWFATAMAHLVQGNRDQAVTALAREIRLDPSFIMSPVWRDGPCAELHSTVIAQLAKGWPKSDRDAGAPPSPDIAAFARWWWTGEVSPPASADVPSPTQRFLQSLSRINDRAATLDSNVLPPALVALRESWRSGAHVESTLVTTDMARIWETHVARHPDDPFSLLLKTLIAPTTRGVQRSADGILFRQTDGDPLTDLTEIPANGLAPILRPFMPPAAVDEYFDAAWTTRLGK